MVVVVMPSWSWSFKISAVRRQGSELGPQVVAGPAVTCPRVELRDDLEVLDMSIVATWHNPLLFLPLSLKNYQDWHNVSASG